MIDEYQNLKDRISETDAREELDLAFDDAMEKVFGPGPGNDGDDIVPQKLAKQFPGRSSRNPDR